MFNIVNVILTRKCNLACKYCQITKDPICDRYPRIDHYHRSQLSPEQWSKIFATCKSVNNNTFFVIYGGEPYLYGEVYLRNLTKWLNENDIAYTYVSNCSSSDIRDFWIRLHQEVGLRGITGSVDPVDENTRDTDPARYRKSKTSLNFLEVMVKLGVPDVVAEVVVDKKTLANLVDTVRQLSRKGIWASCSTVEVALNEYYDFAFPVDFEKAKAEILLDPDETKVFLNDLKMLKDEGCLVHCPEGVRYVHQIGDRIGTMIYQEPPDLNTITIDADGTFRLCYRIRGIATPSISALHDFANSEKVFAMSIYQLQLAMLQDYNDFCEGCSWTCRGFSNVCNFSQISHKQKNVQKKGEVNVS